MNELEKLTDLFQKFPGIGPRQARRFSYFLLTRDQSYLDELSERIASARKTTRTCGSCRRFFFSKHSSECSLCGNPARDTSLLMVVEKDVDVDAVERSGIYQGRYFVLGGSIPVLAEKPEEFVRTKELLKAAEREGLKEIVFALSLTPDGEYTAEHLAKLLSPLVEKRGLTLSSLGRGLSTGSELEYADPETIKNALKHRS